MRTGDGLQIYISDLTWHCLLQVIFPVKKKSFDLKSEETINESVEEDGKAEGFHGSCIYTLANLSHGSCKLITMSKPDSGNSQLSTEV